MGFLLPAVLWGYSRFHTPEGRRIGLENGLQGTVAQLLSFVKNITLKVDEAVYDRARVVAAKRKTSISGLVREYLNSLTDEEEQRREARRLDALKELYEIANSRASAAPDKPFRPLSRDEVYAERLP